MDNFLFKSAICLQSIGHDQLAQLIQNKRLSRDTPEELQKIQELEEQVETLKMETRNRLCQNIDKKYEELTKIRSLHEKEIETMTRQIDSLQEQLEEAMKSRLSMITRQVRIGKLEICLKKIEPIHFLIFFIIFPYP